MREFFRENLKDIVPYKAEPYVCKVKLDANESFMKFPRECREELLEVVETLLYNRYPDQDCLDVREIYANYAGVQRKNVMAGNGSDELIQIIANTFIDDGDKAAVLVPDFSMYGIYIKVAGGNMVEIPLDGNFQLDIDALISTINEEEVKILILSNPNNPTGGVIPEGDLNRISRECNCIFVVDEAYYEFYGKTMAGKIYEYDNLIVLRTCSKAWGLAALRLGFLITNDILMEELLKVKSPYNVNSLTQAAASIALQRQDVIKKNVDMILNERDYLYQGLVQISGLKVYTSYANFILVKARDGAQLKSSLKNYGISIRALGGVGLKDYLRITAGSREENEYLLDCISKLYRGGSCE